MKKLGLAILVCLLTAACNVSTQKSDSYFPITQGNRWVLRDHRTGKITTFEVGAPAQNVLGIRGDTFPLRITKEDAQSYWSPGVDAYIDYYLHLDDDGTLYSPLTISYQGNAPVDGVVPTPRYSIGMVNSRDGEPKPDYILGPLAVPNATVATHYYYDFHGSAVDMSPHVSDPAVQRWSEGFWKSEYTVEQVTTPAYSGPAFCARYSEGVDHALSYDAHGENNAEQWCFAKNVGLVRLTNLHRHIAGVDFTGTNDQVLELVSYKVN